MKTRGYGHLLAGMVAATLFATVAMPALADRLPELECLIEPYVVIDIGSPTHGIVDTLAVDRSDVVQRNDVLAKLDSSQQSAAVRSARARAAMESEIHTREAELALAQRKQERMRELYNSDAISSHARDEVETELKRAQMQLRQARDAQQLARIELERARDDLARRTIRSPIDGVIVERYVAPGEYVNEKPLMRLAQLNPLRIEAIAPAVLFGEIRPGMQAQVATTEGGAQVHSATVTIVDKMIDAASGTFGIRLELSNPDYAIPSGLNCKLQVLANTIPADRHAAAQLKTNSDTPHDTPAKAVCRSFGPFPDAAARAALATELDRIAATVRTRETSVDIAHGYLVLSQQSDSMADARRVAADLKARGAGDLAVLAKGAHARSVSLGWFNDRQNAVDRQQALTGLGIETRLLERLRPATQFWLEAEVQAGALQNASWLQTMPAIKSSACDGQDYVAEKGVGLARTSQ